MLDAAAGGDVGHSSNSSSSADIEMGFDDTTLH